MASTQSIFVHPSVHSIFAETVPYLSSFNPDFHLTDSYKEVHHPEHVPSLFHKRKAQLAIISEASPLKMDPLNWEYMYRPNRPFHFITNRALRRSIPKMPPRPYELRRQKESQDATSAYLAQQMDFFNAIPPPIPEDLHLPENEINPPGPLKVVALWVWTLAISLGWLFGFLPLAFAVAGLRWLGEKGLRKWKEVGGFPWLSVGFALVAWKLAGWLPGMEGKIGVLEEVGKGTAPLYVIMMRNPNQILSGPIVVARG